MKQFVIKNSGLFVSAMVGASSPELAGFRFPTTELLHQLAFAVVQFVVAVVAVMIYVNFIQGKNFSNGFKRSGINDNSGDISSVVGQQSKK